MNPPPAQETPGPPRWWSHFGFDALAFVAWLGVAWWAQWQASDLIWSLWLSSLVVGYSLVVWSIFRSVFSIEKGVVAGGASPAAIGIMGSLGVIGGLFMLAFFTIHFGMFHVVHSAFLNHFFPIDPHARGFPKMATYRTVFARYWYFLPAAFLAERAAFARKGVGLDFTAPYVNVMRMHALIFFFAFAHFAKLENFGVYAVVYAVYFFPWRVLKRGRDAQTPPTGQPS